MEHSIIYSTYLLLETRFCSHPRYKCFCLANKNTSFFSRKSKTVLPASSSLLALKYGDGKGEGRGGGGIWRHQSRNSTERREKRRGGGGECPFYGEEKNKGGGGRGENFTIKKGGEGICQSHPHKAEGGYP